MSKKEYEAMNINETTEYIKAYINKAAYPYAIMLNGDWGTGKSFYAKTTLTTEIKKMHLLDLEGNLSDIKMHPIYLSLYGVDSIDELARHVATEMIVNNSEFVTKARKKTTKILPVVGLGTKMVTSFLGNNILPDKKNLTRELVKLTNTFADFGKYVFIIDDLERSTIPRRQVFGFISNLVETNGAKVIVIANEKEIRDDLENKDKYMNFLSNIDKLELPEIKSESNVLERMLTPTQNASHVTKLDADSLKTLADFFHHQMRNIKRQKKK